MKQLLFIITLLSSTYVSASSYLQVGDDYSKESYSDVYKSTDNDNIKKLIENTVLINTTTAKGRTGRGSGFYLGVHRGQDLFLTNNHVLTKKECESSSNGATISFLKKGLKVGKVKCSKVLASYGEKQESDMTLFTVQRDSLRGMLGTGLEIDFHFSPVAGTLLVQNGFGIKGRVRSRSAERMLTRYSANVAMDSDCLIVSPDNKLDYSSQHHVKNSFATGCDTARGDSGSAVIDRQTGRVVGLIWAQGSSNVKSSKKLRDELIGTNHERVWDSMSYAISLSAEYEKLSAFIER